jgi:hypothetical protein
LVLGRDPGKAEILMLVQNVLRGALMVRPRAFGFNPETALTNAFQHQPKESATEVSARAIAEFDNVVSSLRKAGADIAVVEEPEGHPPLPSSIFPNNWLTFHELDRDGQRQKLAYVYPMCSPSRRLESRLLPYCEQALKRAGFPVPDELHDFVEQAVPAKQYLEGTGSLVFDHKNGMAFACISPRTHLGLALKVTRSLGCKLTSFVAVDEASTPIYHTNVMMSVGSKVSVICAESIADDQARKALLSYLSVDRDIVTLSRDQMGKFGANVLEIRTKSGNDIMAMSQSAYDCLNASQVKTLEKHLTLVPSPIPTIESVEGGSVRCMLVGIPWATR